MRDIENKFSLVDAGDIAKPAADVTVKVLSILEKAGFVFAPLKARFEAKASLIEEIASNENLDPFQRSVLISNYNKIAKEYKNREDITFKALEIIKANTNSNLNSEEMDEDWIAMFMDKAGRISNKELQLIWSKLLAQELCDSSSTSKQLLFILYQMNIEDAERFMKVASFCVDIYGDNGLEFVHPVILKVDESFGQKYGLWYGDIAILESLGLLKYDPTDLFVYVSDKKIEIKYFNEVLADKGRLAVLGAIELTRAGEELLSICERNPDKEKSKYIKESLRTLNDSKSDFYQ